MNICMVGVIKGMYSKDRHNYIMLKKEGKRNKKWAKTRDLNKDIRLLRSRHFIYEIATRTNCDTYSSWLEILTWKATPFDASKVILHWHDILVPSINVPDNSNTCRLLFLGSSVPSKGRMPKRLIKDVQAARKWMNTCKRLKIRTIKYLWDWAPCPCLVQMSLPLDFGSIPGSSQCNQVEYSRW